MVLHWWSAIVQRTLLIPAVTSLLTTTTFAHPIHGTIWDDNLEDVQVELDKGVDVNAKDGGGWTPFHFATREGHDEIVELRLDKSGCRRRKEIAKVVP